MKKNIGIIGTNGFLSKNLISFLDKKKFEIIKIGKTNYDLKCNYFDTNDLIKIFNENKFDTIINCIGYTQIDQLPKNIDLCFTLNTRVVHNITEGIKNCIHKPFLIHFSTDHLYSSKGYSDENDINIKNYYALSKLQSEYIASFTKSMIIRSNFFGKSKHKTKKSLSDWIINSLRKKTKIKVFNDIFFNPINFKTLGKIINLSIQKKHIGIFNVGSSNGMSKANFARIVARTNNLDTKLLIPISSKGFFKTIRPKDMRMNCSKFEKKFKFILPSLSDEIKNFELF